MGNEDNLTPYNYLKKFIDSKIFEKMKLYTNLYSTQKKCSLINTAVSEMYFGIVKMLSFRMHWSDYTRFI